MAGGRLTAVLLLSAAALAGAQGADTQGRLSLDARTSLRAAVEALQQGDPAPARREFASEAARRSIVGPYTDYLYAEALMRGGETARAFQVAEALATQHAGRPVAEAAFQLAAYAAE